MSEASMFAKIGLVVGGVVTALVVDAVLKAYNKGEEAPISTPAPASKKGEAASSSAAAAPKSAENAAARVLKALVEVEYCGG